MTPKQLRRIRREIEHSLVAWVHELAPGAELLQRAVDRAVEHLPKDDADLERALFEVRYALGVRVSLTEILGDDSLDDRVIRQLLMVLEAEIVARLTSEPRRRLPFEPGGFRASPAPRKESSWGYAGPDDGYTRTWPDD